MGDAKCPKCCQKTLCFDAVYTRERLFVEAVCNNCGAFCDIDITDKITELLSGVSMCGDVE